MSREGNDRRMRWHAGATPSLEELEQVAARIRAQIQED
jgi:hypothetical protein